MNLKYLALSLLCQCVSGQEQNPGFIDDFFQRFPNSPFAAAGEGGGGGGQTSRGGFAKKLTLTPPSPTERDFAVAAVPGIFKTVLFCYI